MSLSFVRALTLTLGHEGGYSNDPADHGGATLWGITQRTYDAWRDMQKARRQPVKLMTREEMQSIYQQLYWEPAHCDEMPLNLACCHFDAYVNHRPSVAVRFLQTAVDTEADGAYGPLTKAAIAEALATQGEANVIRAYLDARRDFFDDLVAADASQARFAKGWHNRIDHLAQTLIA